MSSGNSKGLSVGGCAEDADRRGGDGSKLSHMPVARQRRDSRGLSGHSLWLNPEGSGIEPLLRYTFPASAGGQSQGPQRILPKTRCRGTCNAGGGSTLGVWALRVGGGGGHESAIMGLPSPSAVDRWAPSVADLCLAPGRGQAELSHRPNTKSGARSRSANQAIPSTPPPPPGNWG